MNNTELIRAARSISIRTKKSILGRSVGPYQAPWSGAGFEFRQLRAYSPGDDIRFVDWKSSARSGELLVRDYYDEQNRAFLVLLDTSQSMQFSSTDTLKSHVARDIAIALMHSIYFHGDAVGCVYGTSRGVMRMPIRAGSSHLQKMVRNMVTDVASSDSDMSLSSMLEYVMNHFTRPMGIIIISDFLDDTYETALQRLAYKHAVMPIRILDKQEASLHVPHETRLYDPETREQVVMTDDMQDIYHSWFAYYDAYFQQTMRKFGVFSCTCYTNNVWLETVRSYMAGQRK